MKKKIKLKHILSKLYHLLDARQKRSFLFIVVIMILSSALTQFTPKAIGWLTDDILIQEQIEFFNIIPVLLLILVVNVVNELIKILRRIMVEDTATKTENGHADL